MFERVVVATDGSPSVSRAVDVALDLAGAFDADVHALCVLGEEGTRGDAEDAVAAVAARADRAVTTAVREGKPAATVSRYAVEQDADLVAAGTRGRGGPYKFHLGSVAEALVRECPVPVLTVRALEPDAGA